jgi:hypothetical protein
MDSRTTLTAASSLLGCGGAGLRRVGAAGRLVDDHGGEEREPQRQLAARVRGHRRHQVAGGGRLPRHRLLRRHHRPRRARRRQPGK